MTPRGLARPPGESKRDDLAAAEDEFAEWAGIELVCVPAGLRPAGGLEGGLLESILRRVERRVSDGLSRESFAAQTRDRAYSIDPGKWVL